ncbi:MAG: hypothetical protein ACOC5T_09940 [Elusimicrobiota bacterium]
MGDILEFGEKHKKMIKIASSWMKKKMGTSKEEIIIDLETCGNPVFYRLWKLIEKASENVKEKYQRNMMKDFGSLALWILYKDTGYRDQVFWMLWKFLSFAEEIKKELEPYVKEPGDWYVNAWHESKKNTKQAREKGEISEYKKSLDESIFTPPEQARRLNRYRSN